MAEDDTSIEVLTTAECWALLEATNLARIAIVADAGRPEIFPVNFTSHEGRLYLRTAHGTKFAHLRTRPAVALEIDGDDDGRFWSVLVRGEAAQVTVDDEIRRSGIAHLHSANPMPKPFVVRIDPDIVTGRRFPDSSDVAASAHPRRHRGEPDTHSRPTPIPHRRPLSD